MAKMSKVENGVLFENVTDVTVPHFLTTDFIEDTLGKDGNFELNEDILDIAVGSPDSTQNPICHVKCAIDAIKKALVDYKKVIYQSYDILQHKRDNILVMNQKREFKDLKCILDRYEEYTSGMFEYITMILNLKVGEVNLDEVQKRLNTALSNDAPWISNIITSKTGDLEDILDTVPTAIDAIDLLKSRIEALLASYKNAKIVDETDQKLHDVKINAIELAWMSLKTFSTTFLDAVMFNLKMINHIANGGTPPVVGSKKGERPEVGFKML